MTTRFDTSEPLSLEAGLANAALALQRGELVVLPTDTVYGLAADAFDARAVQRLLDAKGRGREMPPPVLIASADTLSALATGVSDWAYALTQAFWPGPLTLVCHQQRSLQWDLGETRGTVAVRVPDHDVALALLQRTGPLAVSSANKSGLAPAESADEAQRMLGENVAVILDAGTFSDRDPSTIIDCTGLAPRILRLGALSAPDIAAVVSGYDVELLAD